jgi:CheY-like chemotaxis protein
MATAAKIRVLLGEEIDLAILDISMPRMTGLQAAAELHRRRPGLRVLMLSIPTGRFTDKAGAACVRLSKELTGASCWCCCGRSSGCFGSPVFSGVCRSK